MGTSVLQDRIAAVEEAMEGVNPALKKVMMLLNSLPDLGKGLTRIQYKKVLDSSPRLCRH